MAHSCPGARRLHFRPAILSFPLHPIVHTMSSSATITATTTTGKVMRDEDKCLICLNLLIRPVSLPCKHELCFKCYTRMMDLSNMNCPFCRKRLSVWGRRSAKLKSLINESRWSEICSQYPAQVRRALTACPEDHVTHTATGKNCTRLVPDPHPSLSKRKIDPWLIF